MSKELSCTHCEKHIVATTQIMWRGYPWHPDCMGEAVAQYRAATDRTQKQLPDDYFNQLEDSMETDEFFDDEVTRYEEDDDMEDLVERLDNIPDVSDDVLNQIPVSSGNGKTELPQHGTMMVHAGAQYVTRYELAGLEVPEGTNSFQPIPHDELIDSIEESLSYRNLSITREEYAVSKDGMKLFALLEINARTTGVGFAIGLRNSNDKSMRLAMVAGGRVVICDNMLLQGEFKPLLAKHTRGFNLTESVSIGIDRIQRNFIPLEKTIQTMKTIRLMDKQAKEFIYDSFLDQNMPISLIKEVHTNYFDSPISEFRDFNVWALLNAYTSAFKRLNPVSQYENTARIGRIINETFIPA